MFVIPKKTVRGIVQLVILIEIFVYLFDCIVVFIEKVVSNEDVSEEITLLLDLLSA